MQRKAHGAGFLTSYGVPRHSDGSRGTQFAVGGGFDVWEVQLSGFHHVDIPLESTELDGATTMRAGDTASDTVVSPTPRPPSGRSSGYPSTCVPPVLSAGTPSSLI